MATALLALLAATPVCADDADPAPRDPRQYFFTPSFGDLPEELAEAKAAGKLGLLLFFEQEGCPYCERMYRTVLSDPRVQDWYRERFVAITVDINGSVEMRDVDGVTLPSKMLAEHRRIKTTPVLSFIALDGSEVHRRSSMVGSPEEMLLLGRYVAEQHYTDTAWRDFLGSEAPVDLDADEVPHVTDLRAAGEAADTAGAVLLLAVMREGCPYCARLRREVLKPMQRSAASAPPLVVRELVMEPDAPVTGFDGAATTTAAVAASYGVDIAPTVLLLDGRGALLAKPLVGYSSPDMYGFYLDESIARALAARREKQE